MPPQVQVVPQLGMACVITGSFCRIQIKLAKCHDNKKTLKVQNLKKKKKTHKDLVQ